MGYEPTPLPWRSGLSHLAPRKKHGWQLLRFLRRFPCQITPDPEQKRSVSPLYSVDMPLARDALGRPTAALREAQSGAGDQILYRAGHQNFVRTRKRRNARTDVNGNSADIVVSHFAL